METQIASTIVLAPHLSYPLRNGGDIYVDRIACHLSTYRGLIFVLSTNTLTHYENGLLISQSRFSNNFRNRQWAAIRTLAFRSHYLVERFLTNAYRKKARELAQRYPEALVIYSLIASASLDVTSKPAIIITQNDEVAYYRNHQKSANNLLIKLTAAFSEKWLLDFLSHTKGNHVFAHISDSDQIAYSNYLLHHKSIIVPAGVEIRSSSPPDYFTDGKIHLLFCGSLGVKMNLDALLFFKNTYWGLLKNYFGDEIDVWVAGSHPTNSIVKLCRSQGWALYPNINDDELNELYETATFGILPFEYSAGVKIKLLYSLAAGLPVLATRNMKTMSEQGFSPNLFSNDPQQWLDHLRKYQTNAYSISERVSCRQFASQYTWQKIAQKMDIDLRQKGF